MRKEVTVTHEILACEVCGRTILKGERTEPYLVQDGSRRLVCELCTRRAESAGWIREATHADMPATPAGAEPRPSLLERFRTRWRADGSERLSRPDRVEVAIDDGDAAFPQEEAPTDRPVEAAAHEEPAYEPEREDYGYAAEDEPIAPEPVHDEPEPHVMDGVDAGVPVTSRDEDTILEEPVPAAEPPASQESGRAGVARGLRRRLRDPRHVRAVPTNAEVKVERALEVFNWSDYRRTIEGLVRTLGEPWVTAMPVLDSTSEVVVVVAWELSWYQYRIDLGDSEDPVALTDKGKELGELDVTLREWNAAAGADGALALTAPRDEATQ